MGFISDLLDAKNQYQAQNVQLQNADYMKQLQQMIGQAGPNGQVGGQQQQLADMLQQQAQGQGPNLAGLQLQAATDRNAQLAAGAAASQRGLNPALAARQILQNQAGVNQQAANQSAQLRMQQQFGAEQQLGGVLGQEQQQNVGLLGELGQLQQGQNQLGVQQNLGIQGINAGVASGNQQAQNNITGGLINAIGGAGAKAFMSGGGEVEGEAEVEGDHEANDTVPALLSPGEVVLPRSIVDGDDIDPKKIVDFVMKSKRMAKGGEVDDSGPKLDSEKVKAFVSAFSGEKREPEPQGYSRVLQSKQKLDKIRGEKM